MLEGEAGPPPTPLPTGIARVSTGVTKFLLGEGWPEELGPTWVIRKKPSRNPRAAKVGVRTRAFIAPANRDGGLRGSWRDASRARSSPP